jgi:NAD(P)H-dependent flavin oxidoreductase YrpB (nitropropane dioxygenase family)
VDASGQPVYDERDDVDLAEIARIGLPFWLAGGHATPEGLRAALAAGAAGVQVGTAFGFCEESGFDPALKEQVLALVAAGTVGVRSDWRASPTGFPFRVVDLPLTLSDTTVRTDRAAVCDLGVLRSAYVTPAGTVDYRCPAEPRAAYLDRKGGHEATMQGRVCLCNALLSSAGMPQRRRNGYVEPPLVTAGNDFTTVARLLRELPVGQHTYSAAAVVRHLLGPPGAGSR